MNIAAVVEEIEARVESMPVRDTQALRALRREYSKRIAAVPAGDVVKIAVVQRSCSCGRALEGIALSH